MGIHEDDSEEWDESVVTMVSKTIRYCLSVKRVTKHCNRNCLGVLFLVIVGCTLITISQLQQFLINGLDEDKLYFLYENRNLGNYVQPQEPTCIICPTALQRECHVRNITRNVLTEWDKIIVYFVTSAPSHWKQRHAIRSTWGREVRPRPVFIVGHNTDPVDMTLLTNEAKLYQDIIVEDFHDSYWNLTLKTGFILKNFLNLCPQADFLVKTDDDMFIQPHLIKEILANATDDDLLGSLVAWSKPHRSPGSKYFLPQWLFNETYLPNYLSGTTYVFPGKQVAAIYERSFKVPLIHLEDVFFSGLVAQRELNLTLIDDLRFCPHRPLFNDVCLFKNYAAIHRFPSTDLIDYWTSIHWPESIEDSCDRLKNRLISFFHNNIFSGL